MSAKTNGKVYIILLREKPQEANMNQKGAKTERELVHLFWAQEWAACRVAGSGRQNYPAPDVIANKQGINLAIECKATKAESQYLEKREVEELKAYAARAGARALIALRFNNTPWIFLNPEDLDETPSSFVATKEKAQLRGTTFEQLTKHL